MDVINWEWDIKKPDCIRVMVYATSEYKVFLYDPPLKGFIPGSNDAEDYHCLVFYGDDVYPYRSLRDFFSAEKKPAPVIFDMLHLIENYRFVSAADWNKRKKTGIQINGVGISISLDRYEEVRNYMNNLNSTLISVPEYLANKYEEVRNYLNNLNCLRLNDWQIRHIPCPVSDQKSEDGFNGCLFDG